MLAVVFWLTIVGANVPSQMLAQALFCGGGCRGRRCSTRWGSPWWLTGFVWHGVFRGLAWVDQRDAAADGDLLSAVHDPRGSRLPAAGGVQPRLPVQEGRRARQAGADHGHGLWLQCRGRDCHARDRLAARAAGRDSHEQLRALQRPLPDADHAGHGLCRGGIPAGDRFARRRGIGRRHRAARRDVHAGRVVGAVAHDPERRGVRIHAGTAALSTAGHAADSLHLADRPDAVRPVAGDVDRGAGRRGDLAARQHRRSEARAWRPASPRRCSRSAGRWAWTA